MLVITEVYQSACKSAFGLHPDGPLFPYAPFDDSLSSSRQAFADA